MYVSMYACMYMNLQCNMSDYLNFMLHSSVVISAPVSCGATFSTGNLLLALSWFLVRSNAVALCAHQTWRSIC